jgi:hypothetical protein
MITKKSTGILSGTGVFTAIAASLCCFTPVLAFLGGSSIAVNLSWMESFRPYLIGASVIALGLAWFQILKSRPAEQCNCLADKKERFFQSKKFLVCLTLLVALMISFPYARAIEAVNKSAGTKHLLNKYSDKEINLQDEKNQKKERPSNENLMKKDCCRQD